ncbi:MAG: signal recognition particle-docking protein FtsY [Thermoanaerobaculia bacterium]
MSRENGQEIAGKPSLWRKLRDGLARTSEKLGERLGPLFERRVRFDAETIEELEEALIGSDLGMSTVEVLLERMKARARSGPGGEAPDLRALLAGEVETLLREGIAPPREFAAPRVTLVVGVNGAGKTTTIAKLARRQTDEGEKVLLAAADTFRAAAIEQLSLWGERLGVDVIRQAQGSDPAAVVFDAIRAARARKVDHLIVDTAGRLHTKEHLMMELGKIRRVLEREAEGWSIRTLLVLDATTGQNALVQAREFLRVATVDGIVLSADGTAKGGIVVAIVRELGLPVLYLGVGEKADDLIAFDPREFSAALVA